jgi:3-hydroxybutyryl-CoA dehydrogenase
MAWPFGTAAVIGLGTTGSALTALLAQSGVRVVGVEVDEEALERGRDRVQRRVANASDAGDLPAPAVRSTLDRIAYTTRIADISAADLVIEAVPERLALKCEVLRKADVLCGKDVVFVTTTTGLSVTGIASASGRMTRTVGLHVFDPGVLAADGVLEVVRTPVTEDAVECDVRELVRSFGRIPVLVGDHPGFVGGALLMAYLNSAATMYEQGYASRDDIDAAMTLGCGLPVGPLAQLDRIGLDVVYDSLCALYERTMDRQFAPAPILRQMMSAGLLGSKTGRGFHSYDGPAGPADDADSEAVRPVRQIGIVGSGTMACGVAEVCARAGYTTVLVARTDVKAKEALAAVEKSLARGVKRGRLTPGDLAAIIGRIDGASDMNELAGCDLVIEAVVEDLAVKREIFARLDRVCPRGTVMATSTSSLPVIECATATSRPQDVLGMHFFNPAPVMKLVEVVRTALTSESAAALVQSVAESVDKHAVTCTDRAGFIVNALLFPYLNRAVAMLNERHLSVDEIDMVMTAGHGYPMGPFRLLDVVGLDVSLAIQRRLWEAFQDPALEPAKTLADLVAGECLGRKSGRGFHDYDKG